MSQLIFVADTEFAPEQSLHKLVNPHICACGYSLESLAARELAQLEAAGTDDDAIDGIDIDSLALDERGRGRARAAARQKAEYERDASRMRDGQANSSGTRER